MDQKYKPQKITVDLNDVTLREALDMVRLQSKSFWRPVSPNTIFVATDSPGKRKELEQNVMKTFTSKTSRARTNYRKRQTWSAKSWTSAAFNFSKNKTP